jgi:hypothetical protein
LNGFEDITCPYYIRIRFELGLRIVGILENNSQLGKPTGPVELTGQKMWSVLRMH